MDSQEQSLIDRIKQAQNVLVTVSVNPSVDQLAAAIGLTIALNKMDKHGTAVFSGQIPNTIEFLKPEETLEKNTDSLRDFIIALDKSKADKLRYKVEDQVVRIFITPYKTSLSEKDLDFSQGDFNVDVVVALGVSQQQDLDAAISAHGRILHDATVASVSVAGQQSNLGTINWSDQGASSLSEMILSLIDGLDKKLLDNQIATALLTGIVASTDRFRNEKTSPKAMSASAELMAAGANQQLIATELETAAPAPEPAAASAEQPPEPGALPEPEKAEPGELDIDHDSDKNQSGEQSEPPPPAGEPDSEGGEEAKPPEPEQPQIDVADDGTFSALPPESQPAPEPEPGLPPQPPLPQISKVHGVQAEGESSTQGSSEVRHDRLTEPPALGEPDLTASASPDEEDEPSTEALSLPPVSGPLLKHNENVLPPAAEPLKAPESPFIPQAPLQPAPPNWRGLEPAPALPPVSVPGSVPPPAPTPAPFPPVPAPVAPPAPAPASVPVPVAPPPIPLPDAGTPLVPLPAPPPFTPPPAGAPAPALPVPGVPGPGGTLPASGQPTDSSRLPGAVSPPPAANLDDARSAVEAAFNGGGSPPSPPLQPIVALNAQPLGADLRPAAPPPPSNTGFNEPAPGNTPADATLDMPLPSNPFGPGRQLPSASPLSATPPGFPPSPASGTPGGDQAPPVPPPFVPPIP